MRWSCWSPALCFLFLACATPIAKLKEHPQQYQGKKVTIEGKVTASANVLFFKGFWVEDATGKLMVIPKGAVPSEGAQVKVTGKVEQLIALGSAQMIVLREE